MSNFENKISILVKIFQRISILVKNFENFEQFRFSQYFEKNSTLVKVFE